MYMFMYMSMLYIYGKIIFVRYFILPKLQEVKKMISQYGENMYTLYMYMMCRRNDFKTQIVLFFKTSLFKSNVALLLSFKEVYYM